MKKDLWHDKEMLEQEKIPDSAHYTPDGGIDQELTPDAPPPTQPPRGKEERPRYQHGYRPYLQTVDWDSADIGEKMIVNMGPQHPSTHGVLRLEALLSGEEVQDIRCHIGYMHRCAEKESENSTFPQIVPYVDRLDYVAPMSNAYGYSLAAERLMNLSVPEDVEYLRMSLNELQRIASHLLAIGTFGIDLGAFTPFLYAFESRENILKLFEYVSGGHLLYNYIWPGGVQRPPPHDYKTRVEAALRDVERCVETEINPVLTGNRMLIDRTANVGVLSPQVAYAYSITGPILRACGVPRDLRKDEPYGLYPTVDFDVPIGRGDYGQVGSALDRYLVRLREIGESVKIVRQCLDWLSDGPIDIHAGLPATWVAPANECYHRTDTPRGELGIFLMSDGKDKPYRVKYRTPGFHAIQMLPEICRGYLLADLPVIIGSLDFVMCECDR